MLIDKVEFKYSKGDKVRYTKNKNFVAYWRTPNSSVPVTEREYTIDGYGFDVTSEGIQKWYLFHAYCDDYFEYHERVNEEFIESISEAVPNVVTDIHFVDAFNEELEIGDNVYHHVYYCVNGRVMISSLAFFSNARIKGFEYTINDNFSDMFNALLQDVVYANKVSGFLKKERCNSMVKNLPDKTIIIKDILKLHDLRNYRGKFKDLYESERNAIEFLGISEDEFNDVWKEVKEKKSEEKSKSKTLKKKSSNKKSKTDDELLEKLSKLSTKEKKKLLELL